MYSHKSYDDVDYSTQSVSDGDYPFGLDEEFSYQELSYLYFVGADGAPTTPSSGTVKLQVTADGYSWATIDGGEIDATTPFDFPPFHVGRARAARFILTGITGVAGMRASIRQRVDHPQSHSDLLTSKSRGHRRVRSESGQTGFYEGRQFRTFKRLSMSNGESRYMRFTCPVDFVLYEETIVLNSGEIDHTAYRQVTGISGDWTDLPVIGRNIMPSRPKPYYAPVGKLQVMAAGGSFVPGEEVGPPLIPKTVGATAQQASVPAGNSRERGLAAGTYYLKSTCVSGPLVGVYYLEWEEHP